jgi:replication factor C subunit 1
MNTLKRPATTQLSSQPPLKKLKEEPCSQLFVDKYKPKTFSKFIGNKDNLKAIVSWIKSFDTRVKEFTVKSNAWKAKRDAWLKKNKGKKYTVKTPVLKRALLVAGPSGIGKTCSMDLVVKEAGYKMFYFAPLDEGLAKKIQPISQSSFHKKSCLVVDGVDYMSGRGDLVKVAKNSSIPVICICNERYGSEMKALCESCDKIVDFTKPPVGDIKIFIKDVCKTEKITIWDDSKLIRLVTVLNQDIRWILNNIQFLHSGEVKDVSMPGAEPGQIALFMAADKLLQPKAKLSYETKQSIINEHDLMPLFVHENYISMAPRHLEKNPVYKQALEKKFDTYGKKIQYNMDVLSVLRLKKLSEAADYISLSDIADTQIKSSQAYELMDDYNQLAVISPCTVMQGKFEVMKIKGKKSSKWYRFPEALGKQSTMTASRKKIIQERYAKRAKDTLLMSATDYTDTKFIIDGQKL